MSYACARSRLRSASTCSGDFCWCGGFQFAHECLSPLLLWSVRTLEGLYPFPRCQGSNCCNLSIGFGLSTSSSFLFAPSGSRVDTDLSTGVRMPSICAAVMVIGGVSVGENMGGSVPSCPAAAAENNPDTAGQ